MLRDRAVRQLVGFIPRMSVVQIHLPLLVEKGLPSRRSFCLPILRRVKPRPADLLLRRIDQDKIEGESNGKRKIRILVDA